jgi:hypothetical protein
MSINPLLEEIIALIINDNKGWKILNFNFPDSFHSQFRILQDLYLFDAVFGENGSRSSDAAQIEPSVGFTGFGHLGTSVALRKRNETPPCLHERV